MQTKKTYIFLILQQICHFFAFLAFYAENDYFDQRLGCAAPKRRSKYTTKRTKCGGTIDLVDLILGPNELLKL